jgi:hypothetical protein
MNLNTFLTLLIPAFYNGGENSVNLTDAAVGVCSSRIRHPSGRIWSRVT